MKSINTSTKQDSDGNTPLHLALLKKPKLKTITYIIKHGGSNNLANNLGYTPLHIALTKNFNLKIFEHLISQQINVFNYKRKNISGNSPLHIALEHKRTDVLKYFLSYDINKQNNDGETPLHIAIEKKLNIESIQFLINSGANVNIKNNIGDTPLHLALAKAIQLNNVNVNKPIVIYNINLIILLINSGANVNITNNNRQTPLHIAALTKNIKLIELLLNSGCDPNIQDIDGYTPLSYSSVMFECTLEIIKLFLKHGANPIFNCAKSHTTILHSAVMYRSKKVIELIFNYCNYKLIINQTTKNGVSPLHNALKYNNMKIAKFLLDKGADVNLIDNYGETPLYIAIEKKANIEIIKQILSHKNISLTIINHINNSYITPLHIALENHDITIVKLLLIHGADPTISHMHYESPLMYAIKKNNYEMIKIILSHSHYNINDHRNNEPLLHYAINHNCNISIIELLLTHGADPNLEYNGNLPLRCTIKNRYSLYDIMSGDSDMPEFITLKLLLKFDANPNRINKYGESPMDYVKESYRYLSPIHNLFTEYNKNLFAYTCLCLKQYHIGTNALIIIGHHFLQISDRDIIDIINNVNKNKRRLTTN